MRVTVARGERRRIKGVLRIAVLALAVVLASTGVLLSERALTGTAGADARPGPSPSVLDARAGDTTPSAAPQAQAAGSARLSLLGPTLVRDVRLRAGAEASVPLPGLPAGSTAVLLEVSLLGATGPGAVTVGSGSSRVTVLQLPKAKSQRTATVVVPPGPDGTLRAGTEGGGRLLVNLVGAFVPADRATSGRIVTVPATQVMRLIPDRSGKDATIKLAAVPALRKAGSISAVVLSLSADVGRRGGFVAAGASARKLSQRFFWTATTGDDRTRNGFLVVPVVNESVHMHYEAGDVLTADVVGYVTGAGAPESAAGLAVPVLAGAAQPVRIPAGYGRDVTVIPAAGINGVPAARVAAVLLGLTATGGAAGEIVVHAPGSAVPRNSTLTAAKGPPRLTLTLVGTKAGSVRVESESGASVSLAPQVVILGE